MADSATSSCALIAAGQTPMADANTPRYGALAALQAPPLRSRLGTAKAIRRAPAHAPRRILDFSFSSSAASCRPAQQIAAAAVSPAGRGIDRRGKPLAA